MTSTLQLEDARDVLDGIAGAIIDLTVKHALPPHTAFRIQLPATDVGSLVAARIPPPHVVEWSERALLRMVETGKFAFFIWPVTGSIGLAPETVEDQP